MGLFKKKDKLNPNDIKGREVNMPTTVDNKEDRKPIMRDMEGPHGYGVKVSGVRRHGDE